METHIGQKDSVVSAAINKRAVLCPNLCLGSGKFKRLSWLTSGTHALHWERWVPKARAPHEPSVTFLSFVHAATTNSFCWALQRLFETQHFLLSGLSPPIFLCRCLNQALSRGPDRAALLAWRPKGRQAAGSAPFHGGMWGWILSLS